MGLARKACAVVAAVAMSIVGAGASAPPVAAEDDTAAAAANGRYVKWGFQQFEFAANGSYEALAGDFDCTPTGGFPGIFFYRAGSAPDFLWTRLRLDGTQVEKTSILLPVTGRYSPLVGDFDGNGCSDIFWYAPGGAPDYVWYFTPSGIDSARKDVGGRYEPVVLANGAAIYWFNPAGRDFFWVAGPSGFTNVGDVIQWDGAGYQPMTFIDEYWNRVQVVWYRRGPATNWLWTFTDDGVDVQPDRSLRNDNDPHTAVMSLYDEAIMYAPGEFPYDRFVRPFGLDQTNSGPLRVVGSYRPTGMGHAEWSMVVWHAPGTARDYLWISPDYFDFDGGYGKALESTPAPL